MVIFFFIYIIDIIKNHLHKFKARIIKKMNNKTKKLNEILRNTLC